MWGDPFTSDTPGNEFTIVSFPLNETISTDRFVFYGDQVIKEYDYNVHLVFHDVDGSDYRLSYAYTRNTDPKTGTLTFNKTNWTVPARLRLPFKLVESSLEIRVPNETDFPSLPNKQSFKFTLYYQNSDPTLGFENSMFHFVREMTVNFSRICRVVNRKYRTINGAYDPCSTAKQVFTIDFRDGTGKGYVVKTDPDFLVGGTADLSLIANSATQSGVPTRNMHFEAEYCKNAGCTERERQTGTYIHRIYVDDGELDNRWWHYTETLSQHDRTFTKIPMRVFDLLPGREFEVKEMHVTVNRAGTYFVRALMPHLSTTRRV